jgi:hypothetical protein
MMDKICILNINEIHATVHELASETHRKTAFQKPTFHNQGSTNVYENQSKSAQPVFPPPQLLYFHMRKYNGEESTCLGGKNNDNVVDTLYIFCMCTRHKGTERTRNVKHHLQ